jgi:hypothetical protein
MKGITKLYEKSKILNKIAAEKLQIRMHVNQWDKKYGWDSVWNKNIFSYLIVISILNIKE